MPNDRSPRASDHLDGIAVIGAGYAGLHAARAAARDGANVTIVDPDGRHDFVTRLAGVAGGTTAPSRASTNIENYGFERRIGTVSAVADGVIELDDGSSLSADAVIVTAGARPTQPPIDGIEHVVTLRSAEDALRIRETLQSADALIVIGGGPTGVQLAGAASATYHELRVHLIESSDRLLPSMATATSDGAARILADRGVVVALDTEVIEISPDGVVTDDGVAIDGIVVWAGGFEARTDGLGLDVNGDGRILVQDDLRVMGMSRTFAAGDVAAHLDADGDFLPMSAQIAVQAGTRAGRNAARLLAGAEPEPATLTQRGWVLDLGGHRGLAEFGPVALTQPFLDLLPPLLHTAIDIKTLFGMGGVGAVRRDAI